MERDNSEDQGLGMRIILKWLNRFGGCGMDISG
jgi:hypothetical protein